jgi:hypothetical protein
MVRRKDQLHFRDRLSAADTSKQRRIAFLLGLGIGLS